MAQDYGFHARTGCGMQHLAALILVVWGGINTVVGNLVLFGVIRPEGGYDHTGMVGHAWLWDPMFLVWGLALALGLESEKTVTESPAHSVPRQSSA